MESGGFDESKDSFTVSSPLESPCLIASFFVVGPVFRSLEYFFWLTFFKTIEKNSHFTSQNTGVVGLFALLCDICVLNG